MKTLEWFTYKTGTRKIKTQWVLLHKQTGYFTRLAIVEWQPWAKVFQAELYHWAGNTYPWAKFKNAKQARKWIEHEIDKASIHLFNDDDVAFIQAPVLTDTRPAATLGPCL